VNDHNALISVCAPVVELWAVRSFERAPSLVAAKGGKLPLER